MMLDDIVITKPVVIVGGGPSLVDFDFSLLDNDKFFVVALNYAYKRVRPDWLHFADMVMFDKHWREIVLLECPKSTCAHVDENDMVSAKSYWDAVGVRYFPNFTRNADLDMGDNNHVCGSNSGHQALNIVAKYGAKEVYLLGFDMQSVAGKAEWHDVYHADNIQTPKSLDDQAAIWREKFATTIPFLEQHNIKVYNSTPNSALKCFEFRDFRLA